ncbi:MAG: hypothetical protein JWM11_519 [Planctomycetaceae bacterium]|nr:hypothetical protein [Planctomycetaceae bacterium]
MRLISTAMNAIYPVLALAAGAALATQVALNGKLKYHLGKPMQATLISLAVGTVAALAICLIGRYSWPDRASLAVTPWWAWCGGLLGVIYLWAAVVVAPRLGIAPTFGLIVAGQIVTAKVIDHFGLLDVPVDPITGWKLLGVGLVIAGVAVLGSAK